MNVSCSNTTAESKQVEAPLKIKTAQVLCKINMYKL